MHAGVSKKGHDTPGGLSLQGPVRLGLAARALLHETAPDLGGEPADGLGEECLCWNEGVEHGEEIGDVRGRGGAIFCVEDFAGAYGVLRGMRSQYEQVYTFGS